jgi:hypothetical protein
MTELHRGPGLQRQDQRGGPVQFHVGEAAIPRAIDVRPRVPGDAKPVSAGGVIGPWTDRATVKGVGDFLI